MSDFVFEPLKLPDDQNAYAFIVKAAALLKSDFFKANEDQFRDMMKGKNWDAALARQWLDGTDAIWPLWEQAAHTLQGQAPFGTGLDSFIPNLGSIQNIARIAQIRARVLAQDGRPDAAIESLLTELQIAQRLQQSHGTLIHYLTATSNRSLTLNSLRSITMGFKASNAVLRDAMHQIEATRSQANALAYSMRSELRLLNWTLEVIETGQSLGTDMPLPTAMRVAGRIPLLLKPNATRRIYLAYLRKNLGAIDREISAQGNLQPAEYQAIFDHRDINIFSPNNILGRSLLAIVTPTWEALLRARLKEQSSTSAHEAFLALVLWHREHGELPATLDVLVPDYLPAVPRDYIDGQPIRYSRESRAVWSVGLHNFNPKGLDPDAPGARVSNEEIYLPLDFAASPK
ncbi:MAG: hypothetical protein WCL04_10170 [Verrucomicrobiota bacterium]